METYKNQKKLFPIQLYLFLLSSNVDVKNNNRNYKKRSEFSGCANSCNESVSRRSW